MLDHTKEKGADDFVFVNPKTGTGYTDRKRWIVRLCKRSGVHPFGYHAIRRLAASVLAKENIPMVDIQRVLRHEALATTERYIRGMNSLAKSMEVLDGRDLGKK